MNTEQERTAFEAWAASIGFCVTGKYAETIDVLCAESAFKAGYQAGRAALQSQGREDAVERLIEVVRYYMSFGCPVCSGDCFSANPPVSACPVREAQEAIDHARRVEGKS